LGRSRALDGVRGIAVLLVLVHHFFQGFTPSDTWLDAAAFSVARSGWCGVDLFFVLSGFLITGVLLEGRDRPRPLRRFYLRRALRILPLYYAVLVLVYVVAPRIGSGAVDAYVQDSASDGPWFWTFLTNFRLCVRGDWYGRLVPDVFWSLAIEEQFYLLWPALVLFCSRRVVMRVALGLVVLAPVARIGMHWADLPPIWSYVLLPTRFDALAAGCLVRLVTSRPQPARFSLLVRLSPWLLVAGLFALYGDLEWSDPLTGTVGLSVLAAGFAGIVFVAVAPPSGRPSRLLESRVLGVLGMHSYALYLIHGPVRTGLQQIIGPEQWLAVFGAPTVAALAFTTFAVCVSLAAAVACHYAFEVPALRLRSRLSPDVLIPRPRVAEPAPTLPRGAAVPDPRGEREREAEVRP